VGRVGPLGAGVCGRRLGKPLPNNVAKAESWQRLSVVLWKAGVLGRGKGTTKSAFLRGGGTGGGSFEGERSAGGAENAKNQKGKRASGNPSSRGSDGGGANFLKHQGRGGQNYRTISFTGWLWCNRLAVRVGIN